MSADEPGALAEREFASTGLAERSGAIAADTAALVPNFNASRRLILLLIAFLAALPRNHITSLSDTLCTGLSLDRSATHLWWPAFRPAIDAPNLAGRYQALGEGHGLLRLRRVAQFPARKIPCPAAFAGCCAKMRCPHANRPNNAIAFSDFASCVAKLLRYSS